MISSTGPIAKKEEHACVPDHPLADCSSSCKLQVIDCIGKRSALHRVRSCSSMRTRADAGSRGRVTLTPRTNPANPVASVQAALRPYTWTLETASPLCLILFFFGPFLVDLPFDDS